MLCSCLLIVGTQAAAQSIAPSFPSVNCSIDVSCDMRLSMRGRIYIFQQSTQQLYVSDLNDNAYATYDLSAYKYQLTGFMDYVPFDELGIVAFYFDDGSGHIELYNLETEQLKILELSAQGKLVPCNYYTRLPYLLPSFISRLGSQNHLLVCSFTPDHTFQVAVLDVENQSIISTIDFGHPRLGEGPILPPWNAMVGGMDGNIYVETNSTPSPNFLADVLANSGPADADYSRVIFRFSLQTNTWDVTKISLQQMQSRLLTNPVPFVTASQLIAVDEQGKYYFYVDWSDDTPDRTRHIEITRLNAALDELALMTEINLGVTVLPSGITADGRILFRHGLSVNDALIVNSDDYAINPISLSIMTPITPVEETIP